MNPNTLTRYLDHLVASDFRRSVLIWGPPGIGKSSIVAQVAEARGIDLIDLRLSQLAPADLRGLPVPEGGVARWYPPEFLPREGAGILFLDELNMAPPAIQGIAQQLMLDRKVGSYRVPDRWLIWAAANRKEDRAAVFDMPAPLANRLIHLDLRPDLAGFQRFGLQKGISPTILAFLSQRPELLHCPHDSDPAWPSPRSWHAAHELLALGLDIAPAVGREAATEFIAFARVVDALPDFEAIFAGGRPPFPQKPDARYATIFGLAARIKTADEALAAMRWIYTQASPREWVQSFMATLVDRMLPLGISEAVCAGMVSDTTLAPAMEALYDLMVAP